ncbi:Hypothetical predicted protein [Octopus vulgaris]|uniref:Cytosolic fatty-acid binding proteins domain-containing protein n=1 Tax=Octopus vulgaris TaxID=6645 RepID=A0AA36AJL8_OCTVU|nr:Hypothetical predicted protein [Octopus vulgaris]
MDNFVGKWEQSDAEPTNFDAFLDATGLPEEARAKLKAARITVEYVKDGDSWKIITTSGSHSKTSVLQIGVPYQSTDLLGRKFTNVVTMDGPNKMKQTCTEWAESTIETESVLSGDTITLTCTTKGVSTTSVFKRA